MEVEIPSRQYSKESWDYVQQFHPKMSEFMGGERHFDGSIKMVGVWEKEERQHAPTFSKIYQQLTGKKFCPHPNSIMEYQPPAPEDWYMVYQHIVSRITTEWGAISVYLWLMSHSTGALQQAIAQPLQDEVNHLAKFWGFNCWAFAKPFLAQLQLSLYILLLLSSHHQEERTQDANLATRTYSIKELPHLVELIFIFILVMQKLHGWNRELSPSFLRHLFGTPPPKSSKNATPASPTLLQVE